MVSGVVLAGVAVLGGCAQPPRGEHNGRVEVTDTTPAEKYSREVQITAQHEFSDQVAQQLAADLSTIPELNQGYRVTVVFGDIVNKTGVVPTSEFEAFRTRIRSKLMQSQNVLKNVRFIENRARLDALRQREMGGGGDILQEGAKSASTLNPKYTYFLNGEMYRAVRGQAEEVNAYYMTYNLMSAEDGTLVWESNQYSVKQVR
jgi:hypothetical protein